MSRFLTAKPKSDSESDSESKSDTELMTKLEPNSDSEQVILLLIIFTHIFC